MPRENPRRLVGVAHVGLHAQDPATLGAFYQRVLGMQVVGGSGDDGPFGASTFLSSRPREESHEIVFFQRAELRHVAFKVGSLADLRSAFRDVTASGVKVEVTLNHGVSLAFYFHDPEGNMIEIYWPTGLEYGQPYGHPVDLAEPEDALYADLERLAARVGVDWSRPAARHDD